MRQPIMKAILQRAHYESCGRRVTGHL